MSSNMENITGWIEADTRYEYNFAWTCPYCGRGATITDPDREVGGAALRDLEGFGGLLTYSVYVRCPNEECRKPTLSVLLFEGALMSGEWHPKEFPPVFTWHLVPPSEARIYPEYVPTPIRVDYEEACLIRDLSPKASATLSRRCLQGMIRDFWGIADDNLYKEVTALKDKVEPKTWRAIDAVRSVGNIGAHMEKDINVIVDVDSNEAAMLIGLIEMLIEDWYVNEHERDQNLSGIINMAAIKQQARKLLPRSTQADSPNQD